MIKNFFKSRTFYGVLLFLLTKALEVKGIVPENPALVAEAFGVSLAFYGARNTAVKKG